MKLCGFGNEAFSDCIGNLWSPNSGDMHPVLLKQEESLAGYLNQRCPIFEGISDWRSDDISLSCLKAGIGAVEPLFRAQAVLIAAEPFLSHDAAGQKLADLPQLQVCHDLPCECVERDGIKYNNGGRRWQLPSRKRQS